MMRSIRHGRKCRAALQSPARARNDDKGWWRELVDLVLDQVAPSLSEIDRDNFSKSPTNTLRKPVSGNFILKFPASWRQLQPRFQLAVISNFDGRLRFILQHLGISKFLRTFSSPVKSERTSPIPKFSAAR